MIERNKIISCVAVFVACMAFSVVVCPAAKKADPVFGAATMGQGTTLVDFIEGLKLSESQKQRFEIVRKQYEKVMAEYDAREKPQRDKLDAAMLKATTPVQKNAVNIEIAKLDSSREAKEWIYFARMLAILTREQQIAWHSVSLKQEMSSMFQKVELNINAEQEKRMDAVIVAYLNNLRPTMLRMNLAGDPGVMSNLIRAYIGSIANSLSMEQRDKLFGRQIESNDVRRRRDRDRRWDRDRDRNKKGSGDSRSAAFKAAIKKMPNVPKTGK